MKTESRSSSSPPSAAGNLAQMEFLPDGMQVLVRPVGPEDVELERRFIAELSPESRRFRFLDTVSAPSEAMLRKLTSVDASREAALAAIDPISQHFVGVGRFSLGSDGGAEIAVAVSDGWQRRGVGSMLARALIAIARKRGIARLYSVDSVDNRPMRCFAYKLGFHQRMDPQDPTQTIYSLDLAAADGGRDPA